MVSLVAVMRSGATVETATIGRAGVIGASAGLGARSTFTRAIVQLPGTAGCRVPLSCRRPAKAKPFAISLCVTTMSCWRKSSSRSRAMRCIASKRGLCRWLLQTHDCIDGNDIPLTQELLGQMLGVRRTTVTIAARLLQTAGLIRYRRGHIQTLDRGALEEVACECYAEVRQNTEKVFTAPSR